MHIPSLLALLAAVMSLLPHSTGLAGHQPLPVRAGGPASVRLLSAPAAATTSTATAAATPQAAAGTATECADGRWIGPDGISMEGRPDGFDPGDRGAVYLWHDAAGWHLRTTDASPGAHLYTGTVNPSPGTRFTAFRTVRAERDDHVWVTADGVLHYSLVTYRGIDGLDFRVSACGTDREREALRFSMDYNGHEDDPSRINLGDGRRHPDSATFVVSRAGD